MFIKENYKKELAEKRTLHTTTHERAKVKMTLVIYGKGIHYQDPDTKELFNYDASLQKIKAKESNQGTNLDGYQYENKSGDIKNYLSKTFQEETSVLT